MQDTGLWGVYFVCDKLNLENMIYNIQMEWMRLCTTVSDFEVQRAKDLLKTNLEGTCGFYNNSNLELDMKGMEMLSNNRAVSASLAKLMINQIVFIVIMLM